MIPNITTYDHTDAYLGMASVEELLRAKENTRTTSGWNLKPQETVHIRNINWDYIYLLAEILEPEARQRVQRWCNQRFVDCEVIQEFAKDHVDYLCPCDFDQPEVEVINACIRQALASDWIEKHPNKGPDPNMLQKLFDKTVTSDPNFCRIYAMMFVIMKDDGSGRHIFDGRRLNFCLQKTPFEFPAVQNLLVDGMGYFGKIDLTQAFLHWEVSEELKQLQGFIGPDG